MTNKDFYKLVSEKENLSAGKVERVCKTIFSTIVEIAKDGDTIAIPGFATFSKTEVPAGEKRVPGKKKDEPGSTIYKEGYSKLKVKLSSKTKFR